MRIAIIGAGNVGAALARGLKGKGHSVVLGVRDPAAAEVAALAAGTDARASAPAEAASGAEIVILALPWNVVEAALASLGDVAGKIVIDCTNPLGQTPEGFGLVVGHSVSGGEMVQGWAPGARVVKTLNQVGAEIMADNASMPQRPVMFMAGDDADAKSAVGRVLADLGFEALDAGGLTKARLLEPFGMVWINQALMRGKGRAWAFAAVERP